MLDLRRRLEYHEFFLRLGNPLHDTQVSLAEPHCRIQPDLGDLQKLIVMQRVDELADFVDGLVAVIGAVLFLDIGVDGLLAISIFGKHVHHSQLMEFFRRIGMPAQGNTLRTHWVEAPCEKIIGT